MSNHNATKLHPPLSEWALEHLSLDYKEVVRLTTVESGKDPPEEPFRSLYSARELLTSLTNKLEACPDPLKMHVDFKVLSSCLQLELGVNYINAEEPGRGEAQLESCLRQLDGLAEKVKTACVSVQALNQLGVLWGNRGEQQKALECLLKAKAVYESHVALPPPITDIQWLLGEEPSEEERERVFEGHHTLTLFYLAQVYGNLQQPKISAQYCRTTLSRQLESGRGGYDPLEWALNCATLSQCYMTSEDYPQSRHCLAAATHVLRHFKAEQPSSAPRTSETTGEKEGGGEEGGEGSRMQEKVKQAEADLSRCWTKYCLSLLASSQPQLRDAAAVAAQDKTRRDKPFKFDTLDLTEEEASVPCELARTYDEARTIFLACQGHVQASKLHYTLEEYASEHALVIYDHSTAYKLLAEFEASGELKCRMHKRRVDMLTALRAELSPRFYLDEHRRILYEVAETQAEMAGIKIVAASNAPSVHSVAKINKLLWSALHNFEQYLVTFHEAGTGALPDTIDEDYLRSILCSKLNIARLYGKIITPENATQASSIVCGNAWIVY